MEINILKFILLNFVRKYSRRLSKNKTKAIVGIIIGIFLVVYFKELVTTIEPKYMTFIPIIIYVYCIMKLMQDAPTINIRPEFLELKVLTVNKLKMVLFVKFTFSSIIVFIVIFLSNINLYQSKNSVIVSLLINIISNFACFFVYQINYTNIFKIATILIISMLYYSNSIAITLCLTVLSILYLLKINYIKYDTILPYYKSISRLSDSFLDGCTDSMSQERVIFNKKPSSSLNLIERHYSNNYKFHIYKEISRIIYHKKTLINSCLMCFVMSLLVFLYVENLMVKFIAIELLIIIADNILSNLNKCESTIRKNGFFLPYSLKEFIVQKFFTQLIITFICVFSGFFLIQYINIYLLLICIILCPIKNIIYNFSLSKITKLISYLISYIIYFLVFLGVYGFNI